MHAYRILPVYTADISGICSALYELGGMVVIHDPSGCNSTYNTHDETRWYDQDSLIFISGLSEVDAVMGNDDRLIRQIADAAEKLHPAFVALVRSPIPYMNGTDFKGIAKLLEKKLGIPVFFVNSNGMHDYICGVGEALLAYAKRMLPDDYAENDRAEDDRAEETEQAVKKDGSAPANRVNVLGMTPLDYPVEGSAAALKRLLAEDGFVLNSCWALETEAQQLQKTTEADINLVISAAGYPLAQYLEETFGIPYVVGVPVGAMRGVVADCLRASIRDRISRIAYADNRINRITYADDRISRSQYSDDRSEGAQPDYPDVSAHSEESVTIVGEAVLAESMAADIRMRFGRRTQIVCLLEHSKMLASEGTLFAADEEEAEAALERAAYVIADPLFQYICGVGAELFPMPHLALSGRCFLKQAKNVFSAMENYGLS